MNIKVKNLKFNAFFVNLNEFEFKVQNFKCLAKQENLK
jgi:hypothetical protein